MSENKKYCPGCDKEIDVSEFYLNRGKPEKYCKVHKMIRQSFNNAQKIKCNLKRKCSKCGETKPLTREYFFLGKSYVGGYKTECICCSKKRNTKDDFFKMIIG